MVSMEVKNLTKNYGKERAVSEISFSLNAGEITVLAGPNGAGKTTTIKCILSLLRKDEGEVFICGKSIKEKSIREKLAYMPETPDIYPYLTVWEHLKFIALAYKLDSWEEKAQEMLNIFGIWDKKDQISKNLSKGMKQKVSICMGLLHNPDIFLIDEPFVGLDPKGIKDFKDILNMLRKQGKTILISTHILSSVEELNDKIIIMKKGKIIANGSKQQLKDKIGGEENMSLEDIFLKISV
ncbi:ABC transporter ATP-binding protein [Haloimpatiens lingqiaonensis]|uniref:ABC transporter ATP-binding protein n=1 Tax=Haloimpatiens lingqiaonensis TaxID=1380675 RepID=UPI0010FDDE56|nr:ABC transporter ATP-binding protein [Haloimpatiens lingqiaonensis]